MPLYRLIYFSRAAEGRPVAEADLEAIVHTARRNNAALGVTTVLLADRTGFLQVLEGRRGRLSTVYRRIVADRRHQACELIEAGPIGRRDFVDHPMILAETAALPPPVLRRYLPDDGFHPESLTPESALALLRAVADEALARSGVETRPRPSVPLDDLVAV